MQTYNAQQALLSIDQHIGVIAIGLVIALGLTFVYFYEAIRAGGVFQPQRLPAILPRGR